MPPTPRKDEQPQKVTRQEAEEAAVQVAQDIQETMDQGSPPYQYPPLSLLTEGTGDIGGEALVELNANRAAPR